MMFRPVRPRGIVEHPVAGRLIVRGGTNSRTVCTVFWSPARLVTALPVWTLTPEATASVPCRLTLGRGSKTSRTESLKIRRTSTERSASAPRSCSISRSFSLRKTRLPFFSPSGQEQSASISSTASRTLVDLRGGRDRRVHQAGYVHAG